MSLGLTFGSFGDFLALVQLANKIRKEFNDAPSQFTNISAEVRSLAIVLQDLDTKLSDHQLDGPQQADLADLFKNCNHVLQDVQDMVKKYRALEYSGRDFGKQAKKAWKRLTWEPEDVKELRERITSNITMMNAFQGAISSQTILETRQGVDRLNRREDDQERTRILEWLSKVDYALQQNDFMSRRQTGTGEWLLNSDQYTDWHQSPQQTLFCPGMPGAGKTICAAIVIDDLTTRFEGQGDVGIAYIYCNFRRRDDQKLEDLLLNLLKQLSQARPSLPDDVKALFERHRERRTRPLFEEVLRALQSVARIFRRIFIVVDALDECQADDGCQARLIAQLFKLQSECGANVFTTSRFTEIVESFKGSLSLEIQAREDDVRKYLDGNLVRLPAFVRRNIALQEEIKSTIVTLVRGMFLLATLHLESLIGRKSAKSLRTTLTDLPTGSDEFVYDQAYKDAMRRIHGQLNEQRDLALQALSWITCAKRPLTSAELLHALAIEEDADKLDEDNISDIEDILTVCAGLVTTEDESGVVRLVHYTTQEFFERTQMSWFPDAEADITSRCLIYLSFEDFRSRVHNNEGLFHLRLASHPFFDYSATHWGDHARVLPNLVPAVMEFLRSSPNLDASSQGLLAGGAQHNQEGMSKLDGLHFASYFGLSAAVSALIDDGNDVDIRDTRRFTPLIWSANRGHEDVAQIFIGKSANIEAQDFTGSTALAWAAMNGHEAVTRLLLKYGADVHKKDRSLLTPLSRAARNGHDAICRALLEGGADVETKDINGWTPLMFAAASGHGSTTSLLLDGGADIHAKGISSGTSLCLAAGNGQENASRILLERGANIEAKDLSGQTTLILAVISGHEPVAKLLLHEGADIKARDDQGQTSLIWAAREHHAKLVQLLVDKGADREVEDLSGRTALFWAAQNGLESSIQVLLEAKARACPHDDIDDITLQIASLSSIGGLFWPALEKKANVNTCDDTYGTALQGAASKGCQDFVQALLDKGADANFRGGLHGTALRAASSKGHLEIVRLLLSNNADVDLQDDNGLTALHAASEEGYPQVVQLLLEHNAKPGLRDNAGETALQAASREGLIKVVDLLLDHIADSDLGDESRETIRANAVASSSRSWVVDLDDF